MVVWKGKERLYKLMGKVSNPQQNAPLFRTTLNSSLELREEACYPTCSSVREHPVFGPYVSDLSMNVVGSFADIQSWLELGNKQRATAATGMNDRSSRSHLVFTLVVTQTKTEFVEEEEHDHMITSRINLVIVTGSKRCSAAQTSGDRLEKAGITFKVDNLLPNLVNLNEDPQLSEMLLYMIREGRPKHEPADKESADDKELLHVQVQNCKLGITTVWSHEKFENNLAAMRELDQVSRLEN
ncbi:UNVERIFIED_CONTAM: hypothetical protein FKN15_001196 [Acipenser sinensis]